MVMLLHAMSIQYVIFRTVVDEEHKCSLDLANDYTHSKNVLSLVLFASLLFLLSSILFIFSSRAPWFSGASSSQSGGNEEQECGEFGCHSTRHETFPVPSELLRAGNHT